MKLKRKLVGTGKVAHFRDEGEYNAAAEGEPMLLLSTSRMSLAWDCWVPPSLWTAVRGRARLFGDDIRVDLDVEGVLVAEHGSRISCQSSAVNSASLMGLLLPPELIRGIARRELGEVPEDPLVFPTVIRNDLVLHALLRRLAQLAQRESLDDAATQPMVEKIVTHMLFQQRDLDAWVNRCPGRSNRYRRQVLLRLLHARNYIEFSGGGDASLTRLAGVARMSTAHFLRVYRDIFGQTPHKHLLQTRLLAARDMLLHSDRDIGEIYVALGFENRCAFTRVFKQYFGVPPTQLRAQLRSPMHSHARVRARSVPTLIEPSVVSR